MTAPALWTQDADFTLWHGDALDTLRTLPDGSVHCCMTSPPFYGLRDYGVDGQIGLEETPDEWVSRLVAVFAEVRRVLRDDGTLWVEIGDSYASGTGAGLQGATGQRASRTFTAEGMGRRLPAGTKPKDLLGQPWMLAFALRANGWYLRSEIIWARPNPMPESVTDRPTKAHSTVFLLSKRPRYYWDADAIREAFLGTWDPRGDRKVSRHHDATPTLGGGLPAEAPRGPDGRRVTTVQGKDGSEQHRDGERWPNPAGANARSVWTIPTEPTPFAHFATFPQELARRCILAGTSERGCCLECGAPWWRETSTDYDNPGNRSSNGTGDRARRDEGVRVMGANVRLEKRVETIGWQPSCDHEAEPIPCVVLDPFMGSGTTALVARKHGRRSIGIELNPDYCKLAAERLGQQSLFA